MSACFLQAPLAHIICSCVVRPKKREQKSPVKNRGTLKLKTRLSHQKNMRKSFPRCVSTVSSLSCIHADCATPDVGQKLSIHVLRHAQGPAEKRPVGALKKGLNSYDREMCDAWNGELDTLLTFVRASSYPRRTTNTKLVEDGSILCSCDRVLCQFHPDAFPKLSRYHQHLPPRHLPAIGQLQRTCS